MKRRTFLILGSLGVMDLYGCLNRQTPQAPVLKAAPVDVPQPTLPPLQTYTPFQPQTPQASPTPANTKEPLTPEVTQTASPMAQPIGDLVADEFQDANNPVTRTIRADSAGEIAVGDGRLQVIGIAPGANDPAIFDRTPIPNEEGQAAGARFQVAFGKETGWIGLASAEGQVFAGLRRTAAEGEGGVLAGGAEAYPVLDLYSDCWYDSVLFLKPKRTAFAINDGAGLELVLVSDADQTSPGYLGYWTGGGEDQDARLGAWYATGSRFFPPELVSQASAPVDYETDIVTNAAWVEMRMTRLSGNAGLRIRSVDRDNEYRVYLDGTNLKLDQVLDGKVDTITEKPMADVPGAKLAVRYNELTLTIYYNGVLTKISPHKIGAFELIAATKIGIYSTNPGNTFTNLSAWAVQLDVPDDLSGKMLHSRQVLCLGDSLTNASKAANYQNRLRKSLGDAWVTVDGGVNSQSTYQMLSRLPHHLRRYSPEVLIVMGGTNDIALGYKETVIKANLQAIYRTAKMAGLRVVAVTIPPGRGSRNWKDEKQVVQEKVNAWILGQSSFVDYRVDAYHLLKEPDGDALLPAYDGGDHVHLSGDASIALADAIFQSVRW
jgi:lysophospholipase L1-like esterase